MTNNEMVLLSIKEFLQEKGYKTEIANICKNRLFLACEGRSKSDGIDSILGISIHIDGLTIVAIYRKHSLGGIKSKEINTQSFKADCADPKSFDKLAAKLAEWKINET